MARVGCEGNVILDLVTFVAVSDVRICVGVLIVVSFVRLVVFFRPAEAQRGTNSSDDGFAFALLLSKLGLADLTFSRCAVHGSVRVQRRRTRISYSRS